MDIKLKKMITQEWLKAFPNLESYAHDKLYMIIGPFVCGLELIKLPRIENYRPHLVIYPIHKEGIDSSLKTPLLIDEFYSLKGNQISLPYDDRETRYKSVQEIVKNSSKLNLDLGIYSISDFFDCADYYLFSHNDVWYKHHSGKRAQLFELKFYAALYTNNKVQLISTINQIEKESENWNMQMFESWNGKFDSWLQALKVMTSNQDVFLKRIQANKQAKKALRLKVLQLK